jgi:hypothetical protein
MGGFSSNFVDSRMSIADDKRRICLPGILKVTEGELA